MYKKNENVKNKPYFRSEELHPDLEMAKWSLEYLPPPDFFWKTDLDMVIRTRKECMMMVEVKKKGSQKKPVQERTYKILDAGLKSISGKRTEIEGGYNCTLNYHGFHYLEIDGTNPMNSKEIKWDDVIISHDELIRKLKFGDGCKECLPNEEICGCSEEF